MASSALTAALLASSRPACPPQVMAALGGREAVERRLRGRWRLSRHYLERLAGVERTHAADPTALAYRDPKLPYSALETGERKGLVCVVGWLRGADEAEGNVHAVC